VADCPADLSILPSAGSQINLPDFPLVGVLNNVDMFRKWVGMIVRKLFIKQEKAVLMLHLKFLKSIFFSWKNKILL
jgi:hypothetical protein